ncbi:MAG: HlyC/CorC family transporter [Clostridia bacterium]|nr:HlyC/CorC family transporter [Clostridia bacterium]
MDIFLSLLIQILLISLNAVFACAETAIISASDVKIAKMVLEGDRRAKRITKFKDKPAKFLSTIQVAITLSGFLGSALAASNFADPIVDLLNGAGIKFEGLYTIVVIVITLLLSFITIVFGELVPKRVAMKNPEKTALGMSGLLMFISKLFAPIVWLLTVSTNGVLRMMRINPQDTEEKVSEEEIVMMVDVGSNAGVIDDTEKEMIKKVFEFDDMTAGEFATHRTDMVILWLEDDNEKWKQIIHETRHSIYPVCGESADDLVGMLNAKDFFRLDGASREEIMKHCVKTAYYVPQTVKADVLFRQMKKTRNRFAVVLDEYGGVFGIVTMNDIIEQIVGGFDEESIQEEEEEIVSIEENVWRIKGSAYLDVVCEKLEITLDEEELEAESYDTFGGLVFGHYGMIPSDGSTFSIDIGENVHVEVRRIVDHRIEEAIVTVTRPEPVLAEDEDGEESF